MPIIKKEILDKIDELKGTMEDGGLEKCLKKVYNKLEEWCAQDIVRFDSDNEQNAVQIMPNYKEAMAYAKSNCHGKFDLVVLQNTAAIVEPVQRNTNGYAEYRNVKATLGEMDYVPPMDREAIHSPMEKIFKFVKKEHLHPVEEAAFLYFHLIRIQPFEFGNKRTASIITNSILDHNSYPCISINKNDNNTFLALLRSAIDGYREDKISSKGLIRQENIGYKQRGFFDYIGNKIISELSTIQDKFRGMEHYQITLNTNNPGSEFVAKKTVIRYLKTKNTCHNVHLDRRNHTIDVRGQISYRQLQKILNGVHGLRYDIKDIKESSNQINNHRDHQAGH